MSDCGKASWEAMELQRERIAHNATKAETKRLREALRLSYGDFSQIRRNPGWQDNEVGYMSGHIAYGAMLRIEAALASAEQQNTNPTGEENE